MPLCRTLAHIQSQVQARITYSLRLTCLSKPPIILSDCTVNTKVCMHNRLESYFTVNSFGLNLNDPLCSTLSFFGHISDMIDWLVPLVHSIMQCFLLNLHMTMTRVTRMITRNGSTKKEKRLQPHPFFHPPGLCLTHFPFYLFFYDNSHFVLPLDILNPTILHTFFLHKLEIQIFKCEFVCLCISFCVLPTGDVRLCFLLHALTCGTRHDSKTCHL